MILSLFLMACDTPPHENDVYVEPVAPPPAEAQRSDAKEPSGLSAGVDAAGNCTINGVWTTTMRGENGEDVTYKVRFQDDGTMRNDGSGSREPGAWRMEKGSTLVLDRSPADGLCKAEDVGSYTVVFGPGCQSFTVGTVVDPCTERSKPIAKAKFERAVD